MSGRTPDHAGVYSRMKTCTRPVTSTAPGRVQPVNPPVRQAVYIATAPIPVIAASGGAIVAR